MGDHPGIRSRGAGQKFFAKMADRAGNRALLKRNNFEAVSRSSTDLISGSSAGHRGQRGSVTQRSRQRRNETRVIGRPQAGRRPIHFSVADEIDVLHRKCTGKQNQVNTGKEARRLRQTGVLATREA